MVGFFMVVGFAALFFLAMEVSNLSANVMLSNDSYKLHARFQNIGSLKVRAPVNLAGVRIGRVESIKLDQENFEAVVTMRISQEQNRIPEDTFASILTAGLLGEQYISLDPGGSSEYLQDGDIITQTQSALILEQMIGKFLFSKAGETNAPQSNTNDHQ
ncbi:ABC transporter substrate-binding protein [Achromatium sp. WMS1]|nr:ABC transporter substrate-binding protein [Achromatium sp. WMS1]